MFGRSSRARHVHSVQDRGSLHANDMDTIMSWSALFPLERPALAPSSLKVYMSVKE